MLCAQIFQKKTPFFLVITLLLLYSGVSPGKFEKKKTYLEKKNILPKTAMQSGFLGGTSSLFLYEEHASNARPVRTINADFLFTPEKKTDLYA